MRQTITFDSIKIRGTKRGKCVCGKRYVRSITFSQTINPFNTNENGNIKTEKEILEELEIKKDKWMKVPVTCRQPDSYYELSDEQQKDYDEGKEVFVELQCGNKVKWR